MSVNILPRLYVKRSGQDSNLRPRGCRSDVPNNYATTPSSTSLVQCAIIVLEVQFSFSWWRWQWTLTITRHTINSSQGFFCDELAVRFDFDFVRLGSMQMSMRKLNLHTNLQNCCSHVLYKLLYPSIRVRTAPPVSVGVRVSVKFQFYGVTLLRILFCMCPVRFIVLYVRWSGV